MPHLRELHARDLAHRPGGGEGVRVGVPALDGDLDVMGAVTVRVNIRSVVHTGTVAYLSAQFGRWALQTASASASGPSLYTNPDWYLILDYTYIKNHMHGRYP